MFRSVALIIILATPAFAGDRLLDEIEYHRRNGLLIERGSPAKEPSAQPARAREEWRPRVRAAVDSARPGLDRFLDAISWLCPWREDGCRISTDDHAMSVTLGAEERTNRFYAAARGNGGPTFKMIVDTGAMSVVLTMRDARRSGIDVGSLAFDVNVGTAGRDVKMARTTLDRLNVEGIVVRNVDALVSPSRARASLLGMSFLGRIDRFEFTNGQMTMVGKRR